MFLQYSVLCESSLLIKQSLLWETETPPQNVFPPIKKICYRFPGKFRNRLLTEILTEVPISHSLTEFNQPFNQ